VRSPPKTEPGLGMAQQMQSPAGAPFNCACGFNMRLSGSIHQPLNYPLIRHAQQLAKVDATAAGSQVPTGHASHCALHRALIVGGHHELCVMRHHLQCERHPPQSREASGTAQLSQQLLQAHHEMAIANACSCTQI
jgi:hypothetical protein